MLQSTQVIEASAVIVLLPTKDAIAGLMSFCMLRGIPMFFSPLRFRFE